jgi:uncharacterized protein YjgD (DUF1641 family)
MNEKEDTMALPVAFHDFTPQNSRHDLVRRLEAAPGEHVEAILATYDLLERLHEKGLIDLVNGLLSASDTVVARAVDVASSEQTVAALRLVLIASNLLRRVDVDRVDALLTPSAGRPRSLWKALRLALSSNSRKGLSAAVGLLDALGAAL